MPMMQPHIAEARVAKQGFGFIAGIMLGPAGIDLVEDDEAALGSGETQIDVREIVRER